MDPWDPQDCDAGARIEPDETTAGILAYYARARAAADAVIRETDIADQLDILRELIEGRAGIHRLD